MSVIHCDYCDRLIDLDFDVDHEEECKHWLNQDDIDETDYTLLDEDDERCVHTPRKADV